MNQEILWVIIALLIAWSSLLTIFFFRLSTHYNSITKGSTGKSLQGILEMLVSDVALTKRDIALLKESYDRIEKDGKFHIQKVGLLRFNPFNDTGGDQSFILTLLDNQDNGVAISGLYSRSGTRWYAKQIKQGKGVEHELSNEEKQAIKQASVHRPTIIHE